MKGKKCKYSFKNAKKIKKKGIQYAEQHSASNTFYVTNLFAGISRSFHPNSWIRHLDGVPRRRLVGGEFL